jgi:hypothetical protein
MICAGAAPSSICAIDPSEAQVSYARQKLAGKPVEILVGDAMTLPSPFVSSLRCGDFVGNRRDFGRAVRLCAKRRF